MISKHHAFGGVQGFLGGLAEVVGVGVAELPLDDIIGRHRLADLYFHAPPAQEKFFEREIIKSIDGDGHDGRPRDIDHITQAAAGRGVMPV